MGKACGRVAYLVLEAERAVLGSKVHPLMAGQEECLSL